MNYSYIAWDFNGTLLDDVYASLASVNDSLLMRNRMPITIDEYYSYIESPIIGFYRHLFDLNDVPFKCLADEFQQGYKRHSNLCRIMPNAVNCIKRFQSCGITQFILSASKRDTVLMLLEKYGLSNFFPTNLVLGRTDHYATGKTDLAESFFSENKIIPQKVLIIGDTLGDYNTAKTLGSDCILLSKGHQARKDLETAGVPVIDDLSELFDIAF